MREQTKFEKELEELINKHCIENGSETPDFLLASYLIGCLENWNITIRNRDKWYNFKPKKHIKNLKS